MNLHLQDSPVPQATARRLIPGVISQAPASNLRWGLPPAQFTTLLTFLCTCVFLYMLKSNYFILTLDEGIFLDGGRRILDGQVPYRDFFILMGPGSFWLQAAAFKLFGTTLVAAHLIMIADVSILAACVCWLVATLGENTKPSYAAWSAAIFVVMETADLGLTLPNHRWDSSALATLAVTIVASDARRSLILLAGIAAALAAWITPTVGLVAIPLVAIMWHKKHPSLWVFLAGFCGASACCAAVLAAQNAFVPMLRQMLWTRTNYSAANYMSYGSRLGGYSQFFDAKGFLLLGQIAMLFGMTLPAILPPVVVLLFWKTGKAWTGLGPVGLILASGLALIAATYPRMDVRHLTYAAPLFYALGAILLNHPRNYLATTHWRMIRSTVLVGAIFLSGIFLMYSLAANFSKKSTIASAVGNLRASEEDAALIRQLQQRIPRSSAVFVYPYLPVLYFLTLTGNPTRFSYLQPGMMNAADEQLALTELMRNPPTRVVYYDLSEQEILRIWSGSDPTRLHLKTIENYLESNYRTTQSIPHSGGNIRILERRTTPIRSTEAAPQVLLGGPLR